MPVVLNLKTEDQKTTEIPLLGSEVTFGRSSSCDHQIVDPLASGKHLSIRLEKGQIVFKDLGSSNGTFLNDVKSSTGHLKIGDVLKIGHTTISINESKLNSSERDLLVKQITLKKPSVSEEPQPNASTQVPEKPVEKKAEKKPEIIKKGLISLKKEKTQRGFTRSAMKMNETKNQKLFDIEEDDIEESQKLQIDLKSLKKK